MKNNLTLEGFFPISYLIKEGAHINFKESRMRRKGKGIRMAVMRKDLEKLVIAITLALSKNERQRRIHKTNLNICEKA